MNSQTHEYRLEAYRARPDMPISPPPDAPERYPWEVAAMTAIPGEEFGEVRLAMVTILWARRTQLRPETEP